MKKNCASCILVIWTISFLITACGDSNQEAEEIIRPVRYQPVYTTGGERERSFSGVARAALESDLSFKVSGTIEQLQIKVGDVVDAGATIARLDDKDYLLQVQEAEAALQQAEAQERNATASYERVRGLYENRNASKNDLDAARAASESANAQSVSKRKRLELARSQLDYTTLKAPNSGAIASVDVNLNENVKAGQIIAMLSSKSALEVEAGVPAILISQVRTGDKTSVSFDAIPNRNFSAQVTEVGVASMGAVTTFPVTVTLEKPGDDLRSGMAADVTFRFESPGRMERMLVPSVSVGQDSDGTYVFIIRSSQNGFGIIERRQVALGELTNEGMEVLSGITDGELIVTAGVSKILDGQKVRINDNSQGDK